MTRSSKRLHLCALANVLVVAATANASAQESAQPWYTYQNVPLGGRTAIMGGAGAAFGSDSAMPLLNPAGLGRVDEHHISMSATAYALHAVDAPNFWTYGPNAAMFDSPNISGPTESYHSQTFNSYPTSFVYSWPLGEPAGEAGHHVISFSVLTPRRYDQELVSTFGVEVAGARIEQVLERSSSLVGYYFGPSYAVQLSPAVRIGVSALGLRHQYFSTTSNLYHAQFGAESQRTIETGTMDGSSWGFVPVAGIQVAPVPTFHIGASVQAQSIDITGRVTRVTTSDQSSSLGFVLDHLATSEVSIISSTMRDARFRILTPTQVTLGLAYEAPRSFALAVDVHYYAPIKYELYDGTTVRTAYESSAGTTVGSQDESITVAGQQVVNVNVGAEVFVSDSVALRFGAFTDMSATPKMDPTPDPRNLYTRRVNMFGGSAGLGLYFGPVDFTVGALYSGGAGDIGASKNLMGGVGGPYQVAPVTESNLMMIVTGGVSFGQAIAPVSDRLKSYETPDEVIDNPQDLLPAPYVKPLHPQSPPAATPPAAAPPASSAPSAPASSPAPEPPPDSPPASPPAEPSPSPPPPPTQP